MLLGRLECMCVTTSARDENLAAAGNVSYRKLVCKCLNGFAYLLWVGCGVVSPHQIVLPDALIVFVEASVQLELSALVKND